MSTHAPHQFGIIGDVHAQADLLETALLFFKRAGVSQLLCVGDIVDGPGDAERCCELLQQWKVPTVRGNHDRWFTEGTMRDLPDITPREELSTTSLRWLQGLPSTLQLESTSGPLLLCHGTGPNDMKGVTPDASEYDLESNIELQALLQENKVRFLVGGHTHRRMVRRIRNLTAINAGTLLKNQHPRVATLNVEQSCVQFHDFENDELFPNCRRVDLART